MKSIKSILSLLAFSLVFVSVSCDDEPIDPAIDPSSFGSSGVIGTYLMTAFNSSVPTDLNNDGTRSTNQMNETNCFNGNTMVLNSDNTFTSTSKGIDIETNGTNEIITCFVDPNITGTWSLSGNQLTLTYTQSGQQFTDIFMVSGSRLTLSITDGEIVGTTSGGAPVYLNADIDIIFTKQ